MQAWKIAGRSDGLIPGLPDDVAVQCLLRVPRMYHHSMRSVSTSWNKLLRSSQFFSLRKKAGFLDSWLVLILMDLVQTGDFSYCIFDLSSKSMICRSLLPLPQTPNHPSADYRLANFRTAPVDTSLIVVESKMSSYRMVLENRTLVFDTVKNSWRSASKLTTPRSNFAMASIDETVYVAGGYDYQGEFETTTEAYDVRKDEWKRMSDIPLKLDRVDCEVVFQGKMYVRGFLADSLECVILVYDPAKDVWKTETSGMSNMDHGELVATSDGIYNLTSADRFYKFDATTGAWRSIEPCQHQKSSLVTSLSTFNVHAQRAFGLGREIFVVGGELGRSSHTIGDSGITYHSLFLGSSWFRAGSIVSG